MHKKNNNLQVNMARVFNFDVEQQRKQKAAKA